MKPALARRHATELRPRRLHTRSRESGRPFSRRIAPVPKRSAARPRPLLRFRRAIHRTRSRAQCRELSRSSNATVHREKPMPETRWPKLRFLRWRAPPLQRQSRSIRSRASPNTSKHSCEQSDPRRASTHRGSRPSARPRQLAPPSPARFRCAPRQQHRRRRFLPPIPESRPGGRPRPQ